VGRERGRVGQQPHRDRSARRVSRHVHIDSGGQQRAVSHRLSQHPGGVDALGVRDRCCRRWHAHTRRKCPSR
jgi:hypothetical protein